MLKKTIDKAKALAEERPVLVVIVVIVVLALVSSVAFASDDDKPAPPLVTNVTNVTEISNFYGVENNEFHSSIAATMAADAIHCTTSSRKHQVGIGSGWSDGHSGFAAGYCHSVEIKGQPFMLGVKASAATDTKPTYSVGMNWTF